MPFYPPEISPEVSRWKEEANALPEPEGGGHILDAILRVVAPQLRRGIGRWAEGTYGPTPWQTIAADTLVPDSPWEEATSITGMPNAMGMVRMGGKSFPNAYLHRALGDPAELDWLANLLQKGRTTQKPTSAVTPSVMSTFGSEPYGLMFNADASKGQIVHAGAADLWSKKRPSDEIDRLGRRYWKASDVLEGRGASDDEIIRLQQIWDRRIKNPPEKWIPPSGEEALTDMYGVNPFVDPERQNLLDVFDKQKGISLSGKGKMFDVFDPKSTQLTHNEIIPNLDASMLAGVRLPLHEPGAYERRGLEMYGADENIRLLDALRQFAEQQHVPIYRWPAEMTQAQQLKGLEDPFAGKWGTPPGRKDYITSSMLKKIFGITELP